MMEADGGDHAIDGDKLRAWQDSPVAGLPLEEVRSAILAKAMPDAPVESPGSS